MVNQVQTTYQQGTEEFNLGQAVFNDLLNIEEVTTLTVHGRPLIVSTSELRRYMEAEDSAITSEEDMSELLAKYYSPEDVENVYRQQIHRRITGKQFNVTELGDATTIRTEELVMVVPRVNVSTTIIEKAVESIEQDDLNQYFVYLPAGEDAPPEEKIKVVTGNTLRTFLNDIQTEEGGMDMNTQISVYASLLMAMPDDDPTKKYGLMQMRSLMIYGDSVSNKNLRLALTSLLKEE